MKTKLTKRFSSLIAILAFLALLAGNAFAEINKRLFVVFNILWLLYRVLEDI
jgi:hypothetical protein